jgi:nucleoside-diphosphate-sugar epimerase
MTVAQAPASALVTGATGFIGGHLARRLADAGCRLRLLVRDPARLAPALKDAIKEKGEVIVGDLSDAPTLQQAVREVQVVFHCAANVHTWDSWQAYRDANVLGTQLLLQAIAAQNPTLTRLVHFSTTDVYGLPRHACDERAALDGGGFGYGESKLRGETLVREFCEQAGIPYVVLRPANVIGPGSQFIVRIGAALQWGIMLRVNGGRCNMGMLYVENLIDRALWAAHAPEALGQCFNVRDAYDVRWTDFIKTFRAGIGGRGLVIDLPYWLAYAVASGLQQFHRAFLPRSEPLLHPLLVRIFGHTSGHSALKIRQVSGLPDRIGYEEAMARSIHWYLEQRRPS